MTSHMIHGQLFYLVHSLWQGFDHHVKEEHNMWNYIYYSVYLETIDISDHNAIEKYVYQKVSVLPYRSISVEKVENDDCYSLAPFSYPDPKQ